MSYHFSPSSDISPHRTRSNSRAPSLSTRSERGSVSLPPGIIMKTGDSITELFEEENHLDKFEFGSGPNRAQSLPQRPTYTESPHAISISNSSSNYASSDEDGDGDLRTPMAFQNGGNGGYFPKSKGLENGNGYFDNGGRERGNTNKKVRDKERSRRHNLAAPKGIRRQDFAPRKEFRGNEMANEGFKGVWDGFVDQQILNRPGMDSTTRNLLHLSVLTTLGRWGELAGHIRRVLGTGRCSVVEVRECLMQVGTYCGIPTGTEAFSIAEKVLTEMEEKGELIPAVAF